MTFFCERCFDPMPHEPYEFEEPSGDVVYLCRSCLDKAEDDAEWNAETELEEVED